MSGCVVRAIYWNFADQRMSRLIQQRRRLQLSAMAPSTRRIRGVQWKCYKNFCQEYKLNCLPCSDDQSSLFASHLSRYLSYTSICNYLQAVGFIQKLYGLVPPSVSSDSVKLTLLGIKKKPNIGHELRAPITLGHLKKFKLQLVMSKPSHVMFWACLLLLFRSLLRVSHVTQSPHNLQVKDVKFISSGMVLIIHSSKTNQGSAPPRYIPIASLQNKSMCAVFWLKHWLSVKPAPSSAPLFRLNNQAMSYKVFQAALSALVSKAGINQKISSHSFRRGGATFLSAIGLPLDKIKERGGWKSDAILTYIAEPIQVKMKREGVVSRVINDMLS